MNNQPNIFDRARALLIELSDRDSLRGKLHPATLERSRHYLIKTCREIIDIVDEEECQHDEHDHGICIDCGEDSTDNLVGAAEAQYEGDR